MAVATARPSELEKLYENLTTVAEDDVRLITLCPGVFADEIECDLFIASLTTEYEALSYTWSLEGSPGLQASSGQDGDWEDVDEVSGALDELAIAGEETIKVNGAVVNVMPNLRLALRHLRSPSEARTLWVDYLCINQASVPDRNVQVTRMDRIYRSATRVVVWLGLEGPDDHRALGELLGLATNVHLSTL